MLNTELNKAIRSVISVLLELTGHHPEAEKLINFSPSSKEDLDEWIKSVQRILNDIKATCILSDHESLKIKHSLNQLDKIKAMLEENQYQLGHVPKGFEEIAGLDNFSEYQIRAMKYLERAA